MISGAVSDDGVPIVTVSILGRNWPAVIDTGFNGDVALPESLRGHLDVRYLGRVMSALAGGKIIEEDAYQVDFPFDGQAIRADATFVVGNEILIGTHLLRNHRLVIDFVSRAVHLERGV